MIEICTVWAARPEHEKWRDDYMHLLRLQRDTAKRFRCRHTVVTDTLLTGFDCQLAELPQPVMPAMLRGVMERLIYPVNAPIIFLDVDALVAREVDTAFDGTFDFGLTRRVSELAPINNGAVYVTPDGADYAYGFFGRALSHCGTHWGADQEAISREAAAVPDHDCVRVRDGTRVAFLSMGKYNCIPKTRGKVHDRLPYVVHFKGDTKAWAFEYATKFLGV